MNAGSPGPARAADRRRAGPAAVLGLDLGTSSAKAVVIDTEGSLLAQASAGYAVTSATAGYAESEPDDWWSAVTACTREAVHAAGAQPAAIGLSGQMHGLVLTSPDGGALRPALLWPDSRAAGALRAYRRLGSAALARLANPLAPGMAGPLLLWIAEHEPRSYAAARWALQPKDWLRARLTGEFHAEPSDASGTLLYDVPGDRWDLATLTRPGSRRHGCWRRCCLRRRPRPAASPPRPGPSSGCPRASRWRPGPPTRPPRCSAAAWSAATTSSSRSAPARRSSARWPTPVSRVDAGVNLYRSATPDGWYQMGATLSAGLSLNWVREIMNATWDELYASAGHPGRADDPIFVPHLSGERTPYSRSGAARLLDRAGAGRRPDVAAAVRAGRDRVRHPRRAGRPAGG